MNVLKVLGSTKRLNHAHIVGKGHVMKTVELSIGKKVFVPFLTYCYVDLRTSMQRLLNSSQFVESCEYWRKISSSESMLNSVYDGRSFWIWRINLF